MTRTMVSSSYGRSLPFHVMVGDRWSLADGEALGAAAPRSFFIPDREHRERLRAGRFVKLVFVLDEPFRCRWGGENGGADVGRG
jgi:hypothetical protein